MPIVDNEFLDLFLPDSSEVSSNDLIEEFKFYIFRIMNLSVEDLMQEQVKFKLIAFTIKIKVDLIRSIMISRSGS